MPSNIDASKPVTGNPTTQSMRDNFAAAKDEINQLQTDVSTAQTTANGKASIAGDLGGSAAAPTVIRLQSRNVANTAPIPNQALVWSGTAWTPTTSGAVPAYVEFISSPIGPGGQQAAIELDNGVHSDPLGHDPLVRIHASEFHVPGFIRTTALVGIAGMRFQYGPSISSTSQGALGLSAMSGTASLYLDSSGDSIFAAGEQELLRIQANGRVSMNLPTTYPGAGSRQLWADPADGYRVKWAP